MGLLRGERRVGGVGLGLGWTPFALSFVLIGDEGHTASIKGPEHLISTGGLDGVKHILIIIACHFV